MLPSKLLLLSEVTIEGDVWDKVVEVGELYVDSLGERLSKGPELEKKGVESRL